MGVFCSVRLCSILAGKPVPPVAVRKGQVPDGHAYTRVTQRDAEGRPIMEQWTFTASDTPGREGAALAPTPTSKTPTPRRRW